MDDDALLLRSLDTLADTERDHIALGLLHAFGAVLIGERMIGWVILGENGKRVALDGRTLTVADVWSTAKALTA